MEATSSEGKASGTNKLAALTTVSDGTSNNAVNLIRKRFRTWGKFLSRIILNRFLKDSPLETINSVCTKEDIIAMQKEAKNVFVHQAIMSYIVDIVNATRSNPSVSIGVSPRGTITMINAARAFAYISGRGYVTPEDIKTLAKYVFAHRLVLRNGFADKDGKEKLIEQIISSVEVPTEEWDR